jgi:hypothetical protein
MMKSRSLIGCILNLLPVGGCGVLGSIELIIEASIKIALQQYASDCSTLRAGDMA